MNAVLKGYVVIAGVFSLLLLFYACVSVVIDTVRQNRAKQQAIKQLERLAAMREERLAKEAIDRTIFELIVSTRKPSNVVPFDNGRYSGRVH